MLRVNYANRTIPPVTLSSLTHYMTATGRDADVVVGLGVAVSFNPYGTNVENRVSS